MSNSKALICPYCGDAQPAAEVCRSCGGLFEPLSRQATHNAMGPWFVRDIRRPFQPGCSYETLVKMIERGQVIKTSIIRGPTTRQFWTMARRVPGLAHLLGYCHACDASVDPLDHGCHACGVPFGAFLDRNFMGLPEVRPLPWEPGYDERAGSEQQRADLAWTPSPTAGAGAGAGSGAGQRGAAGGGGGVGAGISSFASDTEIRAGTPGGNGPRVGHVGTASIAPREVESTAAVAERGPNERERYRQAGQPSAASDVSSPIVRALQRRVAAQQRTARILIVFVATLTILLVISYLPQLAGRMKTDQAVKPSAPREKLSQAESSASESESAVGVEMEKGSSKLETSPGTTDDAAATPGKLAPATPPSTRTEEKPAPAKSEESPSPGPYGVEFERAKQLLELAENPEFSLDDRIAACEEAVLVLENILANKTPAQISQDFEQVLNRARTELERLKLKKLLP